jgi:ketosteroid isomerase-like protein
MTTPLPAILDRYFQADAAGDADALAACFASDATVTDEGRTVQGPEAIAAWMREAKAKYHHHVEPLDGVEHGGRIVVRGRVSGDFPGSPVVLDHAFRLTGERIASLEIR